MIVTTDSSPTWSCGTAGGCEDRIRTAKDTGRANLPLHTSPKDRSGAPSSRCPANSPPG